MLLPIYKLNINSARDFINDYGLMLQGKTFKRSMSGPAVDYFLKRIATEHSTLLPNAIKAVHKHIKYYESLDKSKLHTLRKVVSQHEAQITNLITLDKHESSFNSSIKKALKDSSSKRRARLLNAAKTPIKTRVITETFYRNPDVVAEVLYRASGKCERCHKPAPFVRRKDRTPYLEVHHKKQLVHGGKDIVENAIALCANCHRELHYGIKRS